MGQRGRTLPAFIAFAALVGCGESHVPPLDGASGGVLGETCVEDGDCASGICLSAGRCTISCSTGGDCPSAPWMCVSLPGRGAICDCAPSGPVDVACNDLDDECDGRIDETAISCGDVCVDGASDAMNCGRCGVVCGGGSVCELGACECPADRPDVCGTSCVDLASDLLHCGACGTSCSTEPPGTAACVDGTCGLVCPMGSEDCDGDLGNGCEIDLTSNPSHCAACDASCVAPNSTAACVASTCVIASCAAGFADCDDSAGTGCEAELAADAENCGACGLRCALPNATNRCTDSRCGILSCAAGYADCDANAGNGCEIDTRTDPMNCNACGTTCPGVGRPNTVASCVAARCQSACAAGFGDCDTFSGNGCEVRLDASVTDCGACGRACGAGEVCHAGSCTTRRFSGMTGAAWETIPASGGQLYPGYSDYSPAGSDLVYAATGDFPERLARLSGATLGWTTLALGPDTGDAGDFAGPAWVGSALYLLVAGGVHRYDIGAGTWSTPLTGVPTGRWTQATHDDSGHVYAMTSDGRVATYTIATNSIAYHSFAPAVTDGARIAWDSPSRLLYVVPDFGNASMFSFDPATGTVTPLPSYPASRITPTFCGDRSGHLYASGDNTGTDVRQYDIATSTWRLLPPLPFDHDANGACAVTEAGYLYVTDTGARLARIALY